MRLLVSIVLMAGAVCLTACEGVQDSAGRYTSFDAVAPEVDPGWPREFSKGGVQVLVYQPQVDEWKDYETINYRAAVAVVEAGGAGGASGAGEKGPQFGVITVSAQTDVDQATRMVKMSSEKIEVRFPNATPEEEARLEKTVKEALPERRSLTISLEQVLAYVEDKSPTQAAVPVNLNPPKIFYSDTPAVLVMFMGKPEFKPVPGSNLMFAVNTNWDLFQEAGGSRYYLLNETHWLMSADPVKGPWVPATRLPQDLSRLPADANWDDVRASVPGQQVAKAPVVFTSIEPAELIVTDGKPVLESVTGTALMRVKNCDGVVFMHPSEKAFYYLVAGRWFRSPQLTGPWSAATTSLPAEFQKIPPDGPAGFVLVSVPGTQDAKDAVLLASIPQRATVKRTEATVQVTYEGEPKFVPVEGTAMTYAVNSPYDVIRAEGAYYCCYQGVWFVAYTANGPWIVCSNVPAVIYTIPPSCPLHNVTYVRVFLSSQETVEVGYTSGYTGQYVAGGVVMFGAGMVTGAVIANNSDWYGGGYHYNSSFYSYGCGAVYQNGSYYRGAQAYGPYGGAGRAAKYNPSTGVYSRGAYAYGPSGGVWAKQAYNPNTGVSAARAGGTNAYGSWSRGVATRGDQWVAGGQRSNSQGSAGWVETSRGRAAVGAKNDNGAAAVAGNRGGRAVKTESGDIYAGRDGNVYSRQDGEWSKADGSERSGARAAGGASGANASRSELSAQAKARTQGNARATQTRSTQTRAAPARSSPARAPRSGSRR